MIEKLAKLAKINIEGDLIEVYNRDMSNIIHRLESIKNLEVGDNITPMYSSVGFFDTMRLREDVSQKFDNPEILVALSDQNEDNYVVVPKVINES